MFEKKTAFLVIHGSSAYKPFETLDAFGRGLIQQLRAQHPDLLISHALQPRDQNKDKSIYPWQESFLRIHPDQGENFIDVREYYWSNLSDQSIKVKEIKNWLHNSLAGAKRLTAENEELKKRFQTGDGFYNWRIHRLRWLLWLFKLFQFMPHKRLWGLLPGQWTRQLVHTLNDIAIYTSTDETSRYYEIRRSILKGAVDTSLHLLTKHKYDQVIICGHSLGSVIAYDVLNKLNIKSNVFPKENFGLERLTGFVSFGSPLDKIAFFFRDHVDKNQYIRRQIIDQLFSFRAHELRPDNPYRLIAPLQPNLDHIQWINYYAKKDAISDRLIFSKLNDEDNVELPFKNAWRKAHAAYWTTPAFYDDIIRRFLNPTSQAPALEAPSHHT